MKLVRDGHTYLSGAISPLTHTHTCAVRAHTHTHMHTLAHCVGDSSSRKYKLHRIVKAMESHFL